MIFFNDMKAMIRSPDSDTDYLDIITGVLKGDTLAPFLLIICLITTSINRFNERKQYHTKTGQKQTISRGNSY